MDILIIESNRGFADFLRKNVADIMSRLTPNIAIAYDLEIAAAILANPGHKYDLVICDEKAEDGCKGVDPQFAENDGVALIKSLATGSASYQVIFLSEKVPEVKDPKFIYLRHVPKRHAVALMGLQKTLIDLYL